MTAYNKNFWIPVNVFPGMFTREWSVELNLSDGKKVSFFADKSLVRVVGKDKYTLKVYMLKKDAKRKIGEVILPYEPLENYSSRWVTVPIK